MQSIGVLGLQVAAKDKRLGEIGLQEIYDHEGTFAEARGEGDLADENGGFRAGVVHDTMQ